MSMKSGIYFNKIKLATHGPAPHPYARTLIQLMFEPKF